ncbi:Ribokinase [Clavibacter michiganensis subsp. michiganensis]|uniref:Ribokinase n=1 Tax=Clavibacter michiganensis subsp. michiganensis TaxID=33013 RepID=A0A251XDW3_CLAMM|nr:Ribokinase [Clavibacter michiganensis subsp. michiganensis]OUE00515.1 Ribokinase [Clavibacter michiganensis subsp. michiganensis]
MVGAVGDDADGSAYRARLADRGIDVSGLVTVDDATTGLAIIAVDDDGENTIIVAPGANARVTDAHLDPLDALATGDVLLASLELPLDTVAAGVRRAHAAGARVVLNLAPFAALPADVLALADPVVVNEHEAGLLRESGTPAPASLLVTLGAEGAVWGDVEVPRPTSPASSTPPVRATRSAGRWPRRSPRAPTERAPWSSPPTRPRSSCSGRARSRRTTDPRGRRCAGSARGDRWRRRVRPRPRHAAVAE